ncbi:TPA: hypothetical protein ACKQGK_004433 [Serratia marcescens]
MTNITGQKSTVFLPSAAMHLVVIVLLFFVAWKIADKYIVLSSIPWGVLTILLAPIAYSIALFHKLSETRKNVAEDISKGEARRLALLVDRKRNSSITLLIIQITIILFIAILSLSNGNEVIQNHIKPLTNLAISLMVCSFYSILPSVLGIKEVNDFEAKIKQRKAQNKRVKATLEKLK